MADVAQLSALTKLNGFVRADNGVYHANTGERTFAYSDGEQTEARLHNILESSQDLSSTSAELQAHICDWPTEYHLSSTRSNLLRPLNLSGVTKVLELGCGCGSISRYLGELPGVQVDAIEGSPTRAALAALRCRDLANVTICTANFNDVIFPEGYYDLVLFVGVTEYAGRFSKQKSDQAALQDLLALGKRAANETGITLVAIENRVGLKYLAGACEDHYAVPYVGLQDYPDSSGIRTYTKPEWQQQIAMAGFTATEFVYPLPDYKVPTLVFNESALKGAKKPLKEALQSVKSRDYVADFDLGDKEAGIWHGLLEAGTLDRHANSFLILMSDDAQAISRLSDFSVQLYEIPKLDYMNRDHSDKCGDNVEELKSNQLVIDKLRSESARLRTHAAQLQQTIDTMAASRGWRMLNKLRRLLGNKSIK